HDLPDGRFLVVGRNADGDALPVLGGGEVAKGELAMVEAGPAAGGQDGVDQPARPVRPKNSVRVRESFRTRPRSAEVTVRDPAAFTPRSDMQRCSASRTTPTPFGSSCSSSHPAIWQVSRSWTCSPRAKSSTTRASFDSPRIRPAGM